MCDVEQLPGFTDGKIEARKGEELGSKPQSEFGEFGGFLPYCIFQVLWNQIASIRKYNRRWSDIGEKWK